MDIGKDSLERRNAIKSELYEVQRLSRNGVGFKLMELEVLGVLGNYTRDYDIV